MNAEEYDAYRRLHHPHLTDALWSVIEERHRQDAKFGWVGTPGSLLPGDDDWAKFAVLGEEVGEVARALIERSFGNDTTEHLEEELIQVAAVAVAWVESNREKRAIQSDRSRTWYGD